MGNLFHLSGLVIFSFSPNYNWKNAQVLPQILKETSLVFACGPHRLEVQTATVKGSVQWGHGNSDCWVCLHGYLGTLEKTIFTLPGGYEEWLLQPSICVRTNPRNGTLKQNCHCEGYWANIQNSCSVMCYELLDGEEFCVIQRLSGLCSLGLGET